MGETFDRFLIKVREQLSPEKVASNIALLLEDCTKNRHNFAEKVLIQENNEYFSLMYGLGMVDVSQTFWDNVTSDWRAAMRAPRYFPLSKKAIMLHRDLAQEGYYGLVIK